MERAAKEKEKAKKAKVTRVSGGGGAERPYGPKMLIQEGERKEEAERPGRHRPSLLLVAGSEARGCGSGSPAEEPLPSLPFPEAASERL